MVTRPSNACVSDRRQREQTQESRLTSRLPPVRSTQWLASCISNGWISIQICKRVPPDLGIGKKVAESRDACITDSCSNQPKLLEVWAWTQVGGQALQPAYGTIIEIGAILNCAIDRLAIPS